LDDVLMWTVVLVTIASSLAVSTVTLLVISRLRDIGEYSRGRGARGVESHIGTSDAHGPAGTTRFRTNSTWGTSFGDASTVPPIRWWRGQLVSGCVPA